MAEAVANPAELQMSRELAREKLDTLKKTRRARAESDYFGAGGRSEARAVGTDMVNDMTNDLGQDENASQSIPSRIENNQRLDQFRANVGDRARRFGQIQALRAARKGNQSNAQVAANAQQASSAFAKQAYTRVWMWAEEAVQDFAISFADLMLISGPAAISIFIVRFIGGNMMGGSGTITYQGVSVPRVPGYTSILEGAYKFGKILFIGLISGILYTVIILLVVIITNPAMLVQIGLCSIFSGIVGFFGSTVCSTP